ncbi:MAG: MOSC domain-containing protein [Candidatus Eisenbacteria bacterium]
MPTFRTRDGQVVGSVVGLWRYPVKSMAAEALQDVQVGWHGLVGDRRWAFVRSDKPESGFPWLTIRDRADMSHFRPSFLDPERPDVSPTIVRTPKGAVLDVTDPALAAELTPLPVRVIRQSRGVFDTFPLSVTSTQTIERLGGEVGLFLEVDRFRPNVLVDLKSGEPFEEDRWVGSILRVGGFRMRVDKRDGRCVVITVDPVSGERNPSILRTVAQDRGGCLGVYGTTVEPGSVAIGDEVSLEDTP